jgi:glutamine amidotransferase
MNVIIDYDVGNLESVRKAFLQVGLKTVISKDKTVLEQATSLILPGVGAFNESMEALKKSGLIPTIKAHVKQGKYLFGICLGMQLLYDKSFEFGEYEGLGLLKGTIDYLDVDLKVPHMGWNTLKIDQFHPLLKYINEGDFVYFVHSYYVNTKEENIIASASYGVKVPAIVAKDNIIATQFHPEKSGEVGLNILKAYKELIE